MSALQTPTPPTTAPRGAKNRSSVTASPSALQLFHHKGDQVRPRATSLPLLFFFRSSVPFPFSFPLSLSSLLFDDVDNRSSGQWRNRSLRKRAGPYLQHTKHASLRKYLIFGMLQLDIWSTATRSCFVCFVRVIFLYVLCVMYRTLLQKTLIENPYRKPWSATLIENLYPTPLSKTLIEHPCIEILYRKPLPKTIIENHHPKPLSKTLVENLHPTPLSKTFIEHIYGVRYYEV